MSPKLPVVKAKDLIRILPKMGFKMARQTGSHFIFRHEINHKIVPVPMHSNLEIKKGTLLSILKQADITKEKLVELIRKN